ncbi:hypothetical protein [Saccharopolyspora elongata]|nr:hypothetical protein [Saccharopolyspora elongata]
MHVEVWRPAAETNAAVALTMCGGNSTLLGQTRPGVAARPGQHRQQGDI